ncbi:MAG: hypothetical protein IK151_07590 [Erysipelotrichaceae bacterium]|nr:hypothetical protein [Erysipelotrichaceae bacterium]
MHISNIFKENEKPDIGDKKPDIETIKADIQKEFKPKTAHYILDLLEVFPNPTVFGRSDMMKVINIKSSRTSELLKEMTDKRIIEPVSGQGKGKYRFR